ncbi:MoxR associated protein [Thermococcus chitonophagus]|uniref:MoxR associated protein n=1 Tax=Thermococcus chitonophagus TaxID=54262 RepID=A0A160VVY3_9EURY|nr:DUF58 domain-containing protein [Thermococcus chitonophagus]ASJ17366.1 MoxR associated protein [Thermococcus chitonophagus]CUX78001.1 hypothetical protein CHITON_1222 [Thermococcus chitonophagus]
MKATGRAYSLMTVAWVIVIMSYLLVRWEGIALTLPILTIFLLSSLLFKPTIDIEVSREISSSRVIEGQKVTVKLRIKAKSKVISLYIQDLTPNSVEIIGRNFAVFSFNSGDEREIKYEIKVPRGYHKFEGVRVVYRDPLGLFEEDKVIDLYDEVIGVPQIEDIITPYTTKGTKITIGHLPSPRLGEGLEFHAIREYQPGDPIKIINWKATAKLGKIMVNEFESERKVDVVVIIDATYKGQSVFDYMMRAASSVLLDALENGMSFGILISEAVPLMINVDYGKRHFFRCIDALSMAKPDKNNLIFYQVEHLSKTKIPPRAQIVFISPFLTKESEEALIALYTRGYRVVAISPDPYSTYTPQTKEENLAIKLLSLKRKARLKKMRKYAVIIDWNLKKSLRSAIMEVIK